MKALSKDSNPRFTRMIIRDVGILTILVLIAIIGGLITGAWLAISN